MQRIVIRGKRRDLGLGEYPLVGLAEARRAAFDNRKLARAGGDPMALRRSEAAMPTFAEAFESVIDMHRDGWKNGKTEKRWRATVETYAMKRLGQLRVDEVKPADVMAVLLPIWSSKRETARQVRQRIGGGVQVGRRARPPRRQSGRRRLGRGAAEERQGAGASSLAAAWRGRRRDPRRIASDAWIYTKLAFEFLVLSAARSGEVGLRRGMRSTWPNGCGPSPPGA